VSHEAQLDWERRTGRLAAIAAFVSVALLVGYVVLQQAVALKDRPGNSAEFLPAIDKHAGPWVAASVLQGLSILALAVVLWYLFSATRYRQPALPGWAVYILFVAAVLLAVASVASALSQLDIADRFLASANHSKKHADDLLGDRSTVSVALGAAGSLGMALSLVLINVNAMRVGLVSRFLGIIGVIVGGLQILPLLPPFVLQIAWLGAIGLVFLDRWPAGRGPAWESGEAIPWPTAAQRAAARMEDEDAAAPELEPEPAPEPTAPSPQRSKKRKRKRRR
jgi:hypothetical protein